MDRQLILPKATTPILYGGRGEGSRGVRDNKPHKPSPSSSTDVKLDMVKAQTTELQQIMAVNIEKAIDRSEKLDVIDEKATRLEDHAHQFKDAARKLKWKERWNSYKYYLLILLVLCIILVIILWIAGAFK